MSKDATPHDAAILMAALDESQCPNHALSTLRAENFADPKARQLFRLLGDLHGGRTGARAEIWRVLEAMGWVTPGDNECSFDNAIIRCKAAKDRDWEIRKRLKYVGQLGVVYGKDSEGMLAEAWVILEALGRPKVVCTAEEKTVSEASQEKASAALRVAAERPSELPPKATSQEEINRRKLEEHKSRRAARERAKAEGHQAAQQETQARQPQATP